MSTAERYNGLSLVFAPSVYFVGRIEPNPDEVARFLSDHDAADWVCDAPSGGEALVELGGRLCYMSFAKPRPGGNKAYVGHILEVGHGSVLEHAVYTLIFTGVSRTLTHELIRHRVGLSPSQLSQRYVDESDVAFVVPPRFIDEVRVIIADRPSPMEINRGRAWIASMVKSLNEYRYIMVQEAAYGTERKLARESARSVLLGCTETKIQLTGNARAWRHFLEQRGSVGADAEIRRLALAVLPVLQAESPNLFGDYSIAADGSITTPHRKV